MPLNRETKPATIAINEALSDEIDLEGATSFAIVMPSAWTAANLTVAASPTSGGTFSPVHDDAGTEVTITAAASRIIGVAKASLRGLRFIKLRSGAVGAPTNQASARTLTIITARE